MSEFIGHGETCASDLNTSDNCKTKVLNYVETNTIYIGYSGLIIGAIEVWDTSSSAHSSSCVFILIPIIDHVLGFCVRLVSIHW